MTVYQHFALNVIQLRKQRGWSQEEFAARCGLHRTAMGLIERGKSKSRLDTLLVMAKTLGVGVEDLVKGLRGPT